MTATVSIEAPLKQSEVIKRFVELIARQELDGLVGLYADDFVWEVHVPGCDEIATLRNDLRELHDAYFIRNRDDFAVIDHHLIEDGNHVALRWELSWRDARDGAICTSYQGHFFDIQHGLIKRHQMYCAGVRADEPEV
jgi:ketosteroid isomerase-like protein